MIPKTEDELNQWYRHLTVPKKEKAMGGVHYHHCTDLWNKLTHEEKYDIWLANDGDEAHEHHKWKKGNTSLT